jgi:hypothetical protein
MTTPKDRVLCGNTDTHQPRPAVVRISWPGGRFHSALACASCAATVLWGIRHSLPDEDYPVLVSGLKPPKVTGYSVRDAIVRALSAMEGCDPEATADVVLKALGLEAVDG